MAYQLHAWAATPSPSPFVGHRWPFPSFGRHYRTTIIRHFYSVGHLHSGTKVQSAISHSSFNRQHLIRPRGPTFGSTYSIQAVTTKPPLFGQPSFHYAETKLFERCNITWAQQLFDSPITTIKFLNCHVLTAQSRPIIND
ncbi:hypothetical protein E3N88_11118 [Mikania micrantha]|uniref:Uncharacterized protein n=1 Tax=Mikania micrantha TaxID=192012 RepID=A0A5N6PER7_9ASTR|nr:hypothetical protein E3N88_11118 [Mikania micrantha]